jgi:flagellar biosynthesis/type III secretory pathway protein FliH
VSSKGFQLLSPKTMAQVTEISKTAPRSKAEERQAEKAKAKEAILREEQEAQEAQEAEARAAQESESQEAQRAEVAEAEETVEAAEGSEAAVLAEAATAEAVALEAPPEEPALTVDNEKTEAIAPATPSGPIPEDMQLVSAADIQQMFDEAFAQGREAALQETAVAIEQERQAIDDAAYQRGYDEGHAKAEAAVRDELQAEVELAAEDLHDLAARMAESARDTDSFYAPLLKLAMHLAEQLVRGELSVSSAAIERLIQTSLDEFGQETTAPILVRLNPQDLARFQKHAPVLPSTMTLKADPGMTQGGVRVQMNGAMVEDLIEDRAERLWVSLTSGLEAGSPPQSFLQNVERVKEAFDAVDSVIDATEDGA